MDEMSYVQNHDLVIESARGKVSFLFSLYQNSSYVLCLQLNNNHIP